MAPEGAAFPSQTLKAAKGMKKKKKKVHLVSLWTCGHGIPEQNHRTWMGGRTRSWLEAGLWRQSWVDLAV